MTPSNPVLVTASEVPERTVGLRFGLMADPFVKQLRGQGVKIRDVKEVERCDADNEAISRLTIRGIITERQRDAARKKLAQRVFAATRERIINSALSTRGPDHG